MSASLFTVVPTVGRSRLRLLVLSAVKAVGLHSIAAASEAATEATEAVSEERRAGLAVRESQVATWPVSSHTPQSLSATPTVLALSSLASSAK